MVENFQISGIGQWQTINNSGHIAYAGYLFDPLANYGSSALLKFDGKTTRIMATRWKSVPSGDGKFDGFICPRIDSSGKVSFFANLSETKANTASDYGLFVADNDKIRTIVREGELAPDGDGRFLLSESGWAVRDLAMNRHGVVGSGEAAEEHPVFHAELGRTDHVLVVVGVDFENSLTQAVEELRPLVEGVVQCLADVSGEEVEYRDAPG